MAPAASARPYRDFLTTSLHRRFAWASFFTIILCYLIAVWMGDWSSLFWAVFPLSSVGLRTISLYIPAFFVFMIRVAQWHVGQRNAATPSQGFNKAFAKKSTFFTFALYAFSAWVYGEVYIWTQSQQGKLQFTVDHGRFTERIKMNERPIYLRFMFFTLSLVQATAHIYYDYDQIRAPVKKSDRKADVSVMQHIYATWFTTISRCIIMTVVSFPIGTMAYYILAREPLWNMHYFLVQFFVSLSKNPKPSGLSPFMGLLIVYLVEGFLATILWQVVNMVFGVYSSHEPLKNGIPLTNGSKDPNGSLLNGLKSKKDATKNTAFWELAIITERFADRRKTIFMEPDRAKGATHQQVTNLCLAEIRAILERISIATNPDYNPDVAQDQTPAQTQLVRRIAQPVKDGQILAPAAAPTTRWEKVSAVTSEIARSNSSPQNVQNSYAKEYLKKGSDKASQGVRQAESWWEVNKNRVAASPFGWSFRHSLPRTANVVICGAPYSHQALIFNAVTTLTNLAVHSLREDDFGSFSKEIPDIIRLLTAAIKSIEAYVQSLQIHWTDFDTQAKPQAERRKVPEVDDMVAELKDGLDKIVRAFNEYLPALNMTNEEIREAKKLISKGPEVAQVR